MDSDQQERLSQELSQFEAADANNTSFAVNFTNDLTSALDATGKQVASVDKHIKYLPNKKIKLPNKLRTASFKKSSQMFLDKTILLKHQRQLSTQEMLANASKYGLKDRDILMYKIYLPVGAYNQFGKYIPEPEEYTDPVLKTIISSSSELITTGKSDVLDAIHNKALTKQLKSAKVQQAIQQLGNKGIKGESNKSTWLQGAEAEKTCMKAISDQYRKNAERLGTEIVKHQGKKGVVIEVHDHTWRAATFVVKPWQKAPSENAVVARTITESSVGQLINNGRF